MEETSDKSLASLFNEGNSGWAKAMGLTFLVATEDEVSVEWMVAEQHLQPYGIVHGGVHAGVIETVCSIGAGIAARARGHTGAVVGLENHTSFIRAVATGTHLCGRATPITRGRTTQVWSAEITDDDGRTVARGSVRLLCVAQETVTGTRDR